MSKLRERIRDTQRRKPAALGFARPARRAKTSPVMAVAEVDSADGARAAVEGGAGALLFTGAPAAITGIVEAAGEIPVGCRLGAATGADVEALVAAGADFFVFDPQQTPAETLLDRALGHVMLLPPDADADRLRSFAALDLDAVLVSDPGGSITVTRQLELQRVAELARCPLAVTSNGVTEAATLEVWRDAGVPVVVVPLAHAAALAGIVTAAAAVRDPRERDDERPTPLVPAPAVAGGAIDEEEVE